MQSPTWDAEDLEGWADSKLRAAPQAMSFVSALRRPWRELVPQIVRPTLLIRGDPGKGAIVTAEVAAEAARLCPNLSVARVEGAGHSVRRDRFEAYCEILMGFLESRAGLRFGAKPRPTAA
jgi:N-formylmaleamate deformylase